jgi:hypothetical protein
MCTKNALKVHTTVKTIVFLICNGIVRGRTVHMMSNSLSPTVGVELSDKATTTAATASFSATQAGARAQSRLV